MHYTDASSNLSALAFIKFYGDQKLVEHRGNTVKNVTECFVAVKSGDTLTVHCEADFGGTECQVDLIVDGILRESIYVRATKKTSKKDFNFHHGVHKVSRKTWRGKLITKKYDDKQKGKRYS